MLYEKSQLSSISRCSVLNSSITYRIRKRPVLRQAAFLFPKIVHLHDLGEWSWIRNRDKQERLSFYIS